MKFFIHNIQIEKGIPYPLVISENSLRLAADTPEIVEDLDFILPFPTWTGSLERHHMADILFKMEVGDSFLLPRGYDQRIQTALSYHVGSSWCVNNDIYNMTGRIFKNKSAITENGYLRRYWRLR